MIRFFSFLCKFSDFFDKFWSGGWCRWDALHNAKVTGIVYIRLNLQGNGSRFSQFVEFCDVKWEVFTTSIIICVSFEWPWRIWRIIIPNRSYDSCRFYMRKGEHGSDDSCRFCMRKGEHGSEESIDGTSSIFVHRWKSDQDVIFPLMLYPLTVPCIDFFHPFASAQYSKAWSDWWSDSDREILPLQSLVFGLAIFLYLWLRNPGKLWWNIRRLICVDVIIDG